MSRNAWFGTIAAVCLVVAVSYVGLATRSARGQQVEANPPGVLLEQFASSVASPTPDAAVGTPTIVPAAAAATATSTPVSTPPVTATPAVQTTIASPATATPVSLVVAPLPSPSPAPASSKGYVVFLDGLDPRVAIASLDNPDGPREVTSLRCRRVYFAAGSGVCLSTEGVLEHGVLQILDGRLKPTDQFDTPGLPSRARVANSGRYAATTTFTAGDSYNDAGFSTRTQIIDLSARSALYDMEAIEVTRDGKPFRQVDFNFWGVTFAADGDRYYATLGTMTTTYLVEGSISRRTARVLLEGVECPSLSPDETKIAFKHLVGRGKTTAFWQLSVLDLRTMQVSRVTSEARSVDDQVEWLDNGQLLYPMVRESDGYGYDIWAVPIDGSSAARVFIRNATSPAVVREVTLQATP